jgi:hypothetical protein
MRLAAAAATGDEENCDTISFPGAAAAAAVAAVSHAPAGVSALH